MRKRPAQKVVLIAILGAMAYLLMLLDFPIPFMPPFLSFDLAQISEVIGTLIMGPIAEILIALLKELLKVALTGSGTMFTGELINFIVSVSFILPTWMIYRKNKNTQSAVYGMLLGSMVATVHVCLIFTSSCHYTDKPLTYRSVRSWLCHKWSIRTSTAYLV